MAKPHTPPNSIVSRPYMLHRSFALLMASRLSMRQSDPIMPSVSYSGPYPSMAYLDGDSIFTFLWHPMTHGVHGSGFGFRISLNLPPAEPMALAPSFQLSCAKFLIGR